MRTKKIREQLAMLVKTARRRPAPVALALIVLIGAIGGGSWWLTRERELPDGVAAEVRGKQITVADLNEQVDTLGALYGLTKPSDAKKQKSFRKAAAQAAVMTRVIDLAAKDRNVRASDEEVSRALAQYLNALYGGAADAEQQFTSALATAGTSKKAVETELRRRLVDSRLQAKITGDIKEPTDAEIKAEFKERECTMSVAETRRLRNIVVATKAEASSVRGQLDGGGDFAELAQSMSADASTAGKGGLIGDVAQAQLDTDYGKTAFATGAGKTFGPVKSSSGWNVGQVEAVNSARSAPFEQVAEALKQQLVIERESTAWRKFLLKRMHSDEIRYAPKYRPAKIYDIPDGVASWSEKQQELCSPAGAQQ